MGRVYSKGGCGTCRRRKKKCSEEKPICSTCSRLDLICTYGQKVFASDRRSRSNSSELRLEPTCSIQSIDSVTFRSNVEATVLQSAPSSAVAFFSPVCGKDVRDLRVLWQLTLQEDVLRNAVLAAFSRIRGSSGELGQLDQHAYGRALTLVRNGIHNRELTQMESICLQPAILWLGWVESVGIGAVTSICHWKSLCFLAGQAKKTGFWREIPLKLYILVLEATMIHYSLHSMFTAELRSAWRIWQQYRPVEILEAVNPPGPRCVANSPIVSGQYLLYSIILEAIVLLRYQDERCRVVNERIAEMEIAVRRKIETINDDFLASLSWGCSLEHVVTACQAFRLACNSALLCIIALTEPIADRMHEFDMLASKSLDTLLKTPLTTMTHGTTSWAIAVLACAIRFQSDFDKLFDHWTSIKKQADPGHFGHMDLLFKRLSALRAAQADESRFELEKAQQISAQLPVGLSLLRQEHGVLSDPTMEGEYPIRL